MRRDGGIVLTAFRPPNRKQAHDQPALPTGKLCRFQKFFGYYRLEGPGKPCRNVAASFASLAGRC